MCSTGLLMFRFAFMFDFRKWLIICRHFEMIKEREKKKNLVFCVTIFPEQAQNENKVRIKITFLLRMENA